MPDESQTFAEQCESVVVELLTPITTQAERIMGRVEQWLDGRAPGEAGGVQSLPPRGEPIVSDLAQGMLTAELLDG